MSSKRYPEEFKIEAVKQVVDRGHSVWFAVWLEADSNGTARAYYRWTLLTGAAHHHHTAGNR